MATTYGAPPRRKIKWNQLDAYGSFKNTQLPGVDLGLNPDKTLQLEDGTKTASDGVFKPLTNVDGSPYAPSSSGTGKKFKIPDFKGAANAIAPFASNIINSFRKPPKPPTPHLDSQITLNHVNLNNDRAQVERGIRGENANASKVLDENSAQAVRQQNLGVRATQMSSVNQAEANTNVNVDNEAAKINAGIKAGNNYKLDNYDNAGVERTIAMQRESSANLANAADKYIGIGNEKAKNDLDVRKFGILSKTDTNGVLNRNFQDDPLYLEYQKKYGKPTIQRTGGKMNGRINPVIAARPLKPKHSIVKPFDTKRMLPVLK